MTKITVENVSNGSTVCHPLLLLSGCARLTRTESNIAIHSSYSKHGKASWPVVDGAFKILVFLEPGENTITLESKFDRVQFRVFYKPMETDYFVRLVYIVCRDDCGRFQAPENENNSITSACSRLRLGARMIQTLTAEKIRDYLPERRTFKLEEDNNGEVICHIFTSSLKKDEVHDMCSEELWNHFAVELMQSDLNGGQKCKLLAFLSATEYCFLSGEADLPTSHADVLGCTKGYVALGGGGLALFGTGCLHTWAQSLDEVRWRFADVRKIDKLRFMDDSCNRGEYWACYSTGLGATLHELAHTFDLGHTAGGIMGLGFHDTFKVFTALPGRGGCNCFTSFEAKKREPNHYKVSLIHNIEWSSANNNTRDESSASEADPVILCRRGPCCICRLGASWTRSCAILLYFHKWFNPHLINGNISKPPTITRNEILSDAGIRVVEIRDTEGTLLTHQEYIEGNGASRVVLDLTNRSKYKLHPEVFVVAEDSEGNIIKKKVCLV